MVSIPQRCRYAGPHASGASSRRWGPPQDTDTAAAEPAASAAAGESAARETGTIAQVKPHYGFIRCTALQAYTSAEY